MRLCLITFFILIAQNVLRATTNIAASTSRADVQAAIDLCATGDIAQLPAGTSTWTTNIYVLDKGIEIRGAGQTQTIITDGTTSIPPGVSGLIYVRSPTNVMTVIRDITFSGGGSAYALLSVELRTSAPAYVETLGTPAFLHFYNLSLTNIGLRGVSTVNDIQGLIDHCTFICPVQGTGISPDGTANFSSNRWAATWVPGTTNTLVVEDCVFDWKTTIANGAFDMYSGQHIALRHCIGTNVNWGAHGTDSGGTLRSVIGAEVYNNTMYYNISGDPYSFRGGSVLIFSNEVVLLGGGSGTHTYITLNQYRNTGTNVYPESAPYGCCSPFGPASVTNHWDGDTDQYGYPAMDQLGRTGPTTYAATNTVQTLAPCYFWSNIFNGTNFNGALVGNDVVNTGDYSHIARPGLMVQKNRDWYEGTAKPGYAPLIYPHPMLGISPSHRPINLGTSSAGAFRR